MTTLNDIKEKYGVQQADAADIKRITFLKAAIASNEGVIAKAKKDIAEATRANQRLKKELKILEK